MMTKKLDMTDEELQLLKSVLDIYGAQSDRWPENERSKLLNLVSENKIAHTLFSEAKALDELISSVPDAKVPDDLGHRIILSVSGMDHYQKPIQDIQSGNVVRLSNYQRGSQDSVRRHNIFATTALLAASLLIGIFIGYSELSPLSGLSGAETEIALIGNTEQNEISSPLTQQSLEESLSFTEELL